MILGLLALALAADEPPCLSRAIATLRVDPNGFVVYRELDDRHSFGFWIDCEDPDLKLATAVHESVHLLNGVKADGTYRLYLVGGDRRTVPFGNTPPRSNVLAKLSEDERDHFAETYLSGQAGEQGFATLLDELDAYTHGLVTQTRLADRGLRKTEGHSTARDSVARFLAYVVLYLQALQESDPEAFAETGRSHGEVVGLLWKQAEQALTESAAHDALGVDDHWWLARAYRPEQVAVLDAFVGARVWSSTIQTVVLRDPPTIAKRFEARGGTIDSTMRHLQMLQATVRFGGDVYEIVEGRPLGRVTLVVNGVPSDVRTWEDIEALELPEEVKQALREARATQR